MLPEPGKYGLTQENGGCVHRTHVSRETGEVEASAGMYKGARVVGPEGALAYRAAVVASIGIAEHGLG